MRPRRGLDARGREHAHAGCQPVEQERSRAERPAGGSSVVDQRAAAAIAGVVRVLEHRSELMGAPAIPIATYRLQLTSQFGFNQALELVPYLKSIGISHVYVSPFLTARRGS